MLVMSLSMISVTLTQVAYSQQDYEEYIIMENLNQGINQKNVGSGSSTNINCGTNIAGTNLGQPITCPSIPGETPSPVPGTTVIPVVTQRFANVSSIPNGITSGESQCNSDEVVTGGGYYFPKSDRVPPPNTIVLKEFAVNNAWHVEISDIGFLGVTIKVYAECLKLVPA